MSTPIEKMLDAVDWKPLPPVEPSDVPHATHEGLFQIGPLTLKVYVLSNGQRLVDEASMVRFMCWLHSPEFVAEQGAGNV